MTSSSSSVLVLALLSTITLAGTGCSAFAAESEAATADTTPQLPPRDETGGATKDGPKAPPVGGPANTSDLTDALGVFVAPHGKETATGTRAQPLASIQAAIDVAKRVGKRVYVCAGTYTETVTVADSISIIGGLDCSGGNWRVSAGRSRIEAPTSPAFKTQDIVTLTRLEGLEIVAPDATAESGSSIGILATKSSALVIARSRIVSGNGGAGQDGVEGIQLVNSASTNGGAVGLAAECVNGNCLKDFGGNWVKPAGGAAGTNACEGAPGHETQPGGAGGSGGIWQHAHNGVRFYFRAFTSAYGAEGGVSNRTSANGANAADGTNAPLLGQISPEGYVAANGAAGANGERGWGGAGGNGWTPELTVDPAAYGIAGVWRGYSGGGGGAGGCPGLAGAGGTGGGASIAALLIDSAATIESTELVSARGGDAGRGAFGSTPTAGGAAAFLNADYPGISPTDSKPGGRGGAAGISGNGSNGPSLGIAHAGPAPKVDGATTITASTGGAAIDERSRTDAFGITKTIPATPAGTSTNILAF